MIDQRSPNRSPSAPKIGCPIPQARFWIAMASENVRPYQISDSTSRPVPGSTPSGWSQLTPPRRPIGRVFSSRRLPSPVLWNLYGDRTPVFTRIGAASAGSARTNEWPSRGNDMGSVGGALTRPVRTIQ